MEEFGGSERESWIHESGDGKIGVRKSENSDPDPKIPIFGSKIGPKTRIPGGVLNLTRKVDLRSRTVEGHFLRAFKGDLHAIFKNLQNLGQNRDFRGFLAFFGGPGPGVQKSEIRAKKSGVRVRGRVRKSGKIRKNPEKTRKIRKNRAKKIRKITI